MNILRYLLMRGRTLRNKTIVHVGAHHGQEAARYQDWGASTVVWFEAAPDIYPALQSHLETMAQRKPGLFCRLMGQTRTRHIAIQALVGAEDGGTAEFHLFDNDGASNSMFRMKRGDGTGSPRSARPAKCSSCRCGRWMRRSTTPALRRRVSTCWCSMCRGRN
ncbi:MAG: hypothetical protein Q8S27_06075 [Hoeflea sp.]|nr:hypothetical protein [Hoeflea sp.]